jgi:DNA-binding transcriptional LysR family regulator
MDAIRLFCDVARQRSFSQGAELNGVTQSAASQRIRALEEELGVELIDRSHRPLRLTPAGQIYYRGCRRILAEYEALKRQLPNAMLPLRGRVTAAAIYSADIALLNEIKADFEQAHPEARVQIRYLQPEAISEQVRSDACDFGILSYPDRWRGFESIVWRDETMVLACRADHALARRRSGLTVADIAGCEMAGFEANLPISREVSAYLRRQGVDPKSVSTFDNIDTIKTYLTGTDAVAILPERTVRHEVDRGVLAAYSLEPKLVRPVGIIHRRDSELSPLAQAFIEHLLAYKPPESEAPMARSLVAVAS